MTLLGYQAYDERPPKRDRLRCANCRRWTRAWVIQGLVDSEDPDATSRNLCDGCARAHREGETE